MSTLLNSAERGPAKSEFQRPHVMMSPPIIIGITRTLDLLTITLGGWIAALLYFDNTADCSSYQLISLLAAVIFILTLNYCGGYTIRCLSQLRGQTRLMVLSWCATLAMLALVAYFIKMGASYSRGWTVIWFAATACTLVAIRIGLYVLIERWKQQSWLSRVVAIVGAGDATERLIGKLGMAGAAPTVVAGIFDDRGSRITQSGYRVDGTIDALMNYARVEPIDEIIIALPLSAGKRIGEIVEKLRSLPVDIRLSLDADNLGFQVSGVGDSGPVPMLQILDRPLKHWDGIAKEIEDKILSFLLLLLLAPLLSFIALCIKFGSPGPILFRQTRLGFNNERFEVLKFRTLHANLCDGDAKRSVTPGDPRVTPLGRLLRASSLDELPQLFNVLRGDMSLVGPRPHAFFSKAGDKLFHDAVANYAARHRVKPGITGWAQVHGWRGATDTVEKLQSRVEHDLYYIENWSLAFDLWILLLTVAHLVRPKNAH